MQFSVRTVRRAAVALAVGCTTALTATAASAAPAAPAHTARTSVVIPSCARNALKFRVSQGSGGAGTFTYLLRFTNTSRRTCYMAGFPGVRAVNRHGRQLGSPAAWVSGTRLRTVILRRGWTAHAVLRITNAAFFPHRLCRPAAARGLRVIPPNRVSPGYARLRFLACSRRGTVYMRVQRVQPGHGHLS
ncbi:MAG: hypothetical protein JWL68_927 [Actinomycetia bacterium]|jgi:hypothetical protein|nr:hypothetical protein [Actinomycetes bacterium]MDX6338004.1 hypothetical protein [Streptosporangiaceae bacterium]